MCEIGKLKVKTINYELIANNKITAFVGKIAQRFLKLLKTVLKFKGASRITSIFDGILQKRLLKADAYHKAGFHLLGNEHTISWSPLLPAEPPNIITEEYCRSVLGPLETLHLGHKINIFDIGANFGGHSFLYSIWTKGTGRVFSFEPFKKTFFFLKKNLEDNNFTHAKAFNFGFSDKEMENYLGMPGKSQHGRYRKSNLLLEAGLYSIYAEKKDEHIEEARGQICKFTTLDAFVHAEKINNIDFIKIDVEGHEYHVLKGAAEVLKKHHPVIAVELNAATLHLSNTKPTDILDYLATMNYEFYIHQENTLRKFENKSLESDSFLIDLYCLSKNPKRGKIYFVKSA